jgi:hypothetical protein
LIRAHLAEHGWALVPRGAYEPTALLDPWTFVADLLGDRPLMLERQPIRPVPTGRSLASTRVFAPLHTDSQDFLGAPPALQVMACRRAAAAGGATLLVDGWSLLERIAVEAPDLHRVLFTESRTMPFYFGTVVGPTVARKRGAPVLTVSPMPATDPIGRRLSAFIERTAPLEIAVGSGDVLLVDNHRMLHGRRAFEGDEREFMRFLAWLENPLSLPGRRPRVRNIGLATTEGERRLRVVLEMTTGLPPAKLAARERISEAELYRWRSIVFAAGLRALEELGATNT